jgi:hypothetical protein
VLIKQKNDDMLSLFIDAAYHQSTTRLALVSHGSRPVYTIPPFLCWCRLTKVQKKEKQGVWKEDKDRKYGKPDRDAGG